MYYMTRCLLLLSTTQGSSDIKSLCLQGKELCETSNVRRWTDDRYSNLGQRSNLEVKSTGN